MTVYLPV